MYLLDTNIILELLLDQNNADEVEQFLHGVSQESLYLSEFALYSLGVALVRNNLHDVFLQTVDDLLVEGGIRLVRLGVADMRDVAQAAKDLKLDFDDAYQYVAARKYNLNLVSFDGDFDRTEQGRKVPSEVLADQSARGTGAR